MHALTCSIQMLMWRLQSLSIQSREALQGQRFQRRLSVTSHALTVYLRSQSKAVFSDNERLAGDIRPGEHIHYPEWPILNLLSNCFSEGPVNLLGFRSGSGRCAIVPVGTLEEHVRRRARVYKILFINELASLRLHGPVPYKRWEYVRT